MTTAPRSGRPPALALGAGVVCWLLVGTVHPTAGHGDIIGHIVRQSARTAAVHAVAIAGVAAFLFGLTAFSVRRGIARSAVLGALVIYTLAAVAVAVAGTIDGFIVPGIAAHAGPLQTPQNTTTLALLSACGVAIQAFTKLGFAGFAIAIVLWSVDLGRERGVVRAAGVLGYMVAGATVMLLCTAPHIGPHALIAVGVLQALWYTSLARLLIDDRV